ncbi:restriction endonuclease subunit S [Phyllobacterium leguminum]|uniref:Type I restriction enzyme S subunit n=1 Tax=Phyllobacterium leguminum TaxID=314237 RepID=A0A318SUU6_9HYPH|nr:restriction endonuclease subunit S [Phyllobacterium leguminum]PYE85165.1 type I restriction enzyme S subunit [Phyllobacterium leguminum]
MSEQRFPKGPIGSLIANQIGGGTPSRQNPAFWTGPIPWASVKDFIEDQTVLLSTKEQISVQGLQASAANLIPANTPIVCTRMAVGRVAIAPMDVTINQDLKALVPARDVSTRYLLHLADHAKPKAEGVSIGSTVKGIKVADYLNIQVSLAPSEHQPKIAEILDTLDAAIRRTEAVVAKLKAMKQGLLHDLLTRGIDANGDLRPSQTEAPQLYKQTPLGRLPNDWELIAIKELAHSTTIGPFGSDLVASDYRAEGVPVVFVRDIRANNFLWVSNVFLDARKAQALSAHKVTAGDVVATKMGFPPCISAVYPASMADGIVTADVVCIRPKLSLVHSEWLSASMNSSHFRKQVDQITAGVTRPKVTLKDVRELKIALPKIGEQAAILERTLCINSEIERNEDMLTKLRLLKSGLMDDLLTGRVSVTPLL